MLEKLPAILLALTVGFAGHAAAATDEVKFSLDSRDGILVPVTIDGQGPFTLLLDTGASSSAISSTLADRFKLPAVARTTVLTSTGSELRPVVKLGKTSIGVASAEGLLASVIPAEQLRLSLPGIEGVIGQDFLSSLNYTLDYRRKRLTWSAEGDMSDVRLALVRRNGRLLVQLPATGSGMPMLLVPDSGANGFMIYQRNGSCPVPMAPADGFVDIGSATGRRVARAMTVRELQVGAVMVRDQPAVVVETNDRGGPEGDGLLPLRIFSSVSFNSREGYFVARGR